MTAIATPITKIEHSKRQLVSSSYAMQDYLMCRHPEVMEQLDPGIMWAIDYALLFGDDEARKACCWYIINKAWSNIHRKEFGNSEPDHMYRSERNLRHFCGASCRAAA